MPTTTVKICKQSSQNLIASRFAFVGAQTISCLHKSRPPGSRDFSDFGPRTLAHPHPLPLAVGELDAVAVSAYRAVVVFKFWQVQVLNLRYRSDGLETGHQGEEGMTVDDDRHHAAAF